MLNLKAVQFIAGLLQYFQLGDEEFLWKLEYLILMLNIQIPPQQK